jgi:hypothetical protein
MVVRSQSEIDEILRKRDVVTLREMLKIAKKAGGIIA